MTKNSRDSGPIRPHRLDNAPMDYAPQNELGVVFLFSHLARQRYGFRIEKIQPNFPDCIAYIGEKRCRIEFEFRSKSFPLHKHDSKKCDAIVCWIHDWAESPKRIRIIELRKEYGLGFNVWIAPVGEYYTEILGKIKKFAEWSVPPSASVGDLILFYCKKPHSCIYDLFTIISPIRKSSAGWKKGKDWGAKIKRVCELKDPIFFDDLKRHKQLGQAGFVRGQIRGRNRVTPYWPQIYEMILDRNPGQKKVLANYSPGRIS